MHKRVLAICIQNASEAIALPITAKICNVIGSSVANDEKSQLRTDDLQAQHAAIPMVKKNCDLESSRSSASSRCNLQALSTYRTLLWNVTLRTFAMSRDLSIGQHNGVLSARRQQQLSLPSSWRCCTSSSERRLRTVLPRPRFMLSDLRGTTRSCACLT